MNKLEKIFGLLFCLTLSICVFIILFINGDTKDQRTFAIIFSPLTAAFGIFTFIRDKRHKKSEERTKELITENELFTSAAWRQRYLEYKEKHGFDNIDPKGMKADLVKRSRTFENYAMTLAGAVCLGYCLFKIITGNGENSTNLFKLLPAGLLMFGGGIACIFGLFVRRRIKRMGGKYEDIERSYMSGQMVAEGCCGLNVGKEYTVMFDESNIRSFPTKNIVDAGRKVVCERSYNTGIYIDTDYKYNVFVKVKESSGTHEYEVTLNAFKAEMICEVLRDILQSPDDLEIGYKEAEDFTVTLP